MNLGLVKRMENNGLNSQMLFHDVNLQFGCGNTRNTSSNDPDVMQRKVEDTGRKPRGLTGFVEEKMYSIERDQQQQQPPPPQQQQPYCQNQNSEFRRSIFDNSESDDDEDDEDDEDDDGEVEGLVVVEEDGDGNNKNHNNNNSSGSVDSSSEKMGGEKGNLQKHHSPFGSSRGVLVKENSINIRGGSSEEQNQPGRVGGYENAVTIAEPDNYYSQYMQGPEGATMVQKVIGGENGSGFSVKKDVFLSKESGESLRVILSDPVTGTLMDDAMILPCGHSFGSGGMQHVIRTKACYTCSQPVLEDSVASNLSLRSAVQAFRREEELQSHRAFKRRRERFEQNNSSNHDPFSMDRMDNSRGKGVQFPFAVTDRVIIKGNKRTPLRFVGREAVVTTQCLNGWYVVKTLDNAESVKLQYRSLAKVSDNPSSTPVSSKATPTWL